MRFAVLLFSTLVFGQVQFGLDFRGVLPQGDLEENIDDDGFGLAGRLMFFCKLEGLFNPMPLWPLFFQEKRWMVAPSRPPPKGVSSSPFTLPL